MRIAVSRPPGAQRGVSPLELFFDLVYVFAIGQISHHLVADVDLRTGAETTILALAVFYAWYMAAWGANWLDPDPLPVRGALVGLMFASLLMSVAVDEAFDDRAWLFVTAYLLFQVGRCAFLIVALRGRPQSGHFVNNIVWELLDGVLWVAGAIADGDARLLLWGLAVAGGVRRWVGRTLAARAGQARRPEAYRESRAVISSSASGCSSSSCWARPY
jgi:low temperature requirement protein LtrA